MPNLPHSTIEKLVANWPRDLREAYNERAAIMQFDGRMTQEAAENAAYNSYKEKVK